METILQCQDRGTQVERQGRCFGFAALPASPHISHRNKAATKSFYRR